jgi:hypothetical protein
MPCTFCVRRARLGRFTLLVLAALSAWPAPAVAAPPEDFPQFLVPGREREMDSLRRLFWLHAEAAGPLIPLWDEWMPMATLWPARGEGPQLQEMRRRWAAALAGRTMNAEGYIHTRQHDGPAHAEGWPFPRWMEAGGVGWHFRPLGVAGYEPPLASPEGWNLMHAEAGAVDDRGWRLSLTAPRAAAESPSFSISAATSPWLRLNWWSAGLGQSDCYVEWTTKEHPEYGPERRMHFSASRDDVLNTAVGESRIMVPLYRSPAWKGTITRLRVAFENAGEAEVVVKSIHTACDTRHNVNNLNFVRGCHDYFLWSRDIGFLRSQMDRIRASMRYVESEFQTRDRHCIYTTWPGHEGRSGVRVQNGVKQVIPGEGIGSNYWDLLPFGGEDALATVYYYDALADLAELEEALLEHPEWAIAAGPAAYDPAELRQRAQEVKQYAGQRFWNADTGRFGTRDLDGGLHDYGFTFLNNEAVYYGFATPEQADSIHTWIAGKRVVAGDTSTGADIYHWRFGPRSTTRRNVDYYFWNWSNPERIPWGYQVQDGGAVLGWSYHDLMARLMTAGADDAAVRLKEILAWFDETQAEGGYRAYYEKDPSRGTMQGGNVAGGLGLDKEFFESVLVPQVMLYGFLGLRPTADGFAISPQLPSDWPELTVTRIHLHDAVLDVSARHGGEVHLSGTGPSDQPLAIEAAPGVRVTADDGIRFQVVRSAER